VELKRGWDDRNGEARRCLRHVDAFVLTRLQELGLGRRRRELRSERPFTFRAAVRAHLRMQKPVEQALARAGLPGQHRRRAEAAGLRAGRPMSKRLPSPLDATVDGYKASERARRQDRDLGRNFTSPLSSLRHFGERLFVAYEYLAEPCPEIEDYRSQRRAKEHPGIHRRLPVRGVAAGAQKDSDPRLVDRFERSARPRAVQRFTSSRPEDQAARFAAQLEAQKSAAAEETWTTTTTT